MDELHRQAIGDFQNGFSDQQNTCELISRVDSVMPMELDSKYKIASVQESTSKVND